jgi:hypothetical protein
MLTWKRSERLRKKKNPPRHSEKLQVKPINKAEKERKLLLLLLL